ncbi:hypothetical protein C8R43DRAFT_982393 [Mycena crocata]|nr:hypothetical protein C8R43DRAFT_982393 [Mycena crocata]
MSFFANCKDFKITGGEFNEIKGNVNKFSYTTRSATVGSHNYSTGGGGRSSQFRGSSSNAAYQGPTEQFQPQSSHLPGGFRQNGGWDANSIPDAGALPDPRTPYPEDEVTAQILRDSRTRRDAPKVHASGAPFRSASSRGYPRGMSASPWPASHAPRLPIPMRRPHNSSRQASQSSGHSVLSSSPEDNTSSYPSWAPRHTPAQQLPRSSYPIRQTAPFPPRSNSTRSWQQDDDDSSSDSDSEDERPARSAGPIPSQSEKA